MINGVLMQGFHWYIKPDEKLWKQLKDKASELKEAGFTAIWLPPAYKAMGGINDTGYGAYDLYDLGEFDQKGTIATKYGTKDEYLECIEALKKEGIQVYVDVVLNHKMGADDKETVKATGVLKNHRLNEGEEEEIEVETIFNFPGRKGTYSDFTWNATHFDGIDYDTKTHKNTIYLFEGKDWDNQVDNENDNYDYLMGCDLDFSNKEVVKETTKWLKWYLDTTKADGLRLDAVKHIPARFYEDMVIRMRNHVEGELFTVGEYWHGDVNHLLNYLHKVNHCMCLFDVPLHYHLYDASQSAGYNMAHIFENTLVKERPFHAVTFVDNHDSEPTQSLASFIPDWFKGQAYCLTLLRADGYPCVFYGDYYGIEKEKVPSRKYMIDAFLKLRKEHNIGAQIDYFNHHHLVGWTNLSQNPMAVLLTNHIGGSKWMYVGKEHAGSTFENAFNGYQTVAINQDGYGEFFCEDRNFAVYVKKES